MIVGRQIIGFFRGLAIDCRGFFTNEGLPTIGLSGLPILSKGSLVLSHAWWWHASGSGRRRLSRFSASSQDIPRHYFPASSRAIGNSRQRIQRAQPKATGRHVLTYGHQMESRIKSISCTDLSSLTSDSSSFCPSNTFTIIDAR